MKINIEKNIVEFAPESGEETAKLETLWKLLIDCNNAAKKLTPIGEYIPAKGEGSASFYIEGLELAQSGYVPVAVLEDCQVYCQECNKILPLKKGNTIPVCCGKTMEIVD